MKGSGTDERGTGGPGPPAVILCDMDGVLATGAGMDTRRGEPIYRTFTDSPDELERIRSDGIPLHVLTAKVEAEAAQVLEAIGLDGHIASVIGADRLFWPTLWKAVRRRRMPSSLSKSVYHGVLPSREGQRIVMIENHAPHLRDMLEANTIDFGILVPPITVDDRRILEWFDLNLALRLARRLATGSVDGSELSRLDVSVFRFVDGEFGRLDLGELPVIAEGGGYLLRLPGLSFADSPSAGPTMESLDTGRVLMPAGRSVVSTVRAGRRALRRLMGRRSGSRES